jgi:hypothetical protein
LDQGIKIFQETPDKQKAHRHRHPDARRAIAAILEKVVEQVDDDFKDPTVS